MKQETRQAFVHVAGKNGIYYRTGDRVRRSAVDKPLVYLGRVDNQIKVLGHRVELGEVEAAIRQVSGLEGVVALGWPVTESGADGIEVFLETDGFDTKALAMQLKEKLPVYMLPRHILVLDRFPLNANGKYNRKALQLILEKKFRSDGAEAGYEVPPATQS